MLFRRLIQIHIRPEADKQHQEDVDEGLSAWKAVRIVESMPDKIQRIDGKARKKDQEQSAVDGFLLHCDLLTCEIHQKEEEYRCSFSRKMQNIFASFAKTYFKNRKRTF